MHSSAVIQGRNSIHLLQATEQVLTASPLLRPTCTRMGQDLFSDMVCRQASASTGHTRSAIAFLVHLTMMRLEIIQTASFSNSKLIKIILETCCPRSPLTATQLIPTNHTM